LALDGLPPQMVAHEGGGKMSLINQMLQDLEARSKKGQTVAPMPSAVRPIAPAPLLAVNPMWVVVFGLALLLLVLVVWVVPRQMKGAAPAVAPRPAVATSAGSAAASAPVARPLPVSPKAAASVASGEGTPAPELPANVDEQGGKRERALARALVEPTFVPAAPGQGTQPLSLKLMPELASLTRPASAKPAQASGKDRFIDVEPVSSKAARPAVASETASTASVPRTVAKNTAAADAPPAPAGSADNGIKLTRQPLTSRQSAESEYRKALQAQQQGRQPEAMALLTHALQIDSAHLDARQTMVAWLLEQGQRAQALRVLQEGLGHDPAQPALAMILARLQVDQGDAKAALDTLNRSLAWTLGRADYQAFMAALLQREGRHKEAILRYQNALALTPDSAVWWMGLGISFQAEGQKANAREAFERARNNPGLTPELLAFVAGRISQLQ
jgi:MSHA biogenesis protein MshN